MKFNELINKLGMENGHFTFDGQDYVLVRPAYADGMKDNIYYTAPAICVDDTILEGCYFQVYDVKWYPLDAWLDSGSDDEGWAFNWEEPDEVSFTAGKYDFTVDRLF